MDSAMTDDTQYGDPGFYYRIPGGLLYKDVIEIQGTFIGKSISVDLLANVGEDEEITKSTPLQLILDADGSWFVNVTDEFNHLTQKSGRGKAPASGIFHVIIISFEDRYDINLNSELLCSQLHIVPLSEVTHLSITGEAEFTAVEFTDLLNESQESERSSMHTLEDESNFVQSQKGFIRLSQKRQSENRRPQQTINVPLNNNSKEIQDMQRLSRTSEENSDTLNIEELKKAGLRSFPPTDNVISQIPSNVTHTHTYSLDDSTKGHDEQQTKTVWGHDEGREINVDSGEVITAVASSGKSVTFPGSNNSRDKTEDSVRSNHKKKHGSLFGKHSNVSKSKGEKKSRSSTSPPSVSSSLPRNKNIDEEKRAKKKHSFHLTKHKSKNDDSKSSPFHKSKVSVAPETKSNTQNSSTFGYSMTDQQHISPKRGSYNIALAEKINTSDMQFTQLKSITPIHSPDIETTEEQLRQLNTTDIPTSSIDVTHIDRTESGKVNIISGDKDSSTIKADMHIEFGRSSSGYSATSSEPSFAGIKSERGSTDRPGSIENATRSTLVMPARTNVEYFEPPVSEFYPERIGVNESFAPMTISSNVNKYENNKSAIGQKSALKPTKEEDKLRKKSDKIDRKHEKRLKKTKSQSKSGYSDKNQANASRSSQDLAKSKNISKSEPAITDQGDKEKQSKRRRIADAFRRLFGRHKKGKKSKSETDLEKTVVSESTKSGVRARSSGSELSLNAYETQPTLKQELPISQVERKKILNEPDTKLELPPVHTAKFASKEEFKSPSSISLPLVEKIPEEHEMASAFATEIGISNNKIPEPYRNSESISESTTVSSDEDIDDYNISIERLDINSDSKPSLLDNHEYMTNIEIKSNQNQFSAVPMRSFRSNSNSSRSSRSSISSTCQRVIIIGQSEDYQNRLASFKKRKEGLEYKGRNNGRVNLQLSGFQKDGNISDSSSTSSISSIESSRLPPNVRKSKVNSANDLMQPFTSINTDPSKEQKQLNRNSVNSEPYRATFEGSAKLPNAKFGAEFWNDVSGSSSSDLETPDSLTKANEKVHPFPKVVGKETNKGVVSDKMHYDSSSSYSD